MRTDVKRQLDHYYNLSIRDEREEKLMEWKTFDGMIIGNTSCH